MRRDLAGDEVAGDNAACFAIDHDEIQHLSPRIHGYSPGMHLPLQRLICAEQKLLARLSARVERSGDLRTAERAVSERAAVFTREGNALCNALIDDVDADLCQPVHVGLARAKIAALYRVVEEAVYAVAIILIIFCGVDAALGRDGMRTTGRILKAEALYVVSKLSQRG